jgi:class 3 adenylate cyclase
MSGGYGTGFRSMGSASSMTTRLAAAVVGVSLVSLLVATIVGLTAGRDLGTDLYEDRLVAMSASASSDAKGHMTSLQNTAAALATSPQAVAALDAFADGHAELLAAPGDLTAETAELVTRYQEQYVAPLRAAGRDLDLRDIAPENEAGVYLQSHYSVEPDASVKPDAIVDAGDGSAWTEAHSVIHPVYRDVVDRRNLVDLYLVEPENGYVVYSASKRPDLGTSLDAGPFSGTQLASVTAQLRDDPSLGVLTNDLSFYDPALTTPVGVIAAPVMDGPRLAGVFVMLYDNAPLTELLTADGDWDEGRFPPTGETFLVGADGTTRSEPRTFIEDPKSHLDAAAEAGLLTDDERQFIEASGTTILTQRVAEATADAGPEGDEGVERHPTMDGREAFSTVATVSVDSIDWWAVAEMEVEAAEGDIDRFGEVLIVGSAIFVVALAFLAVGWANGIVSPVRLMSDRLGSDRRINTEPLVIPPRSPVEFHQLAASFGAMSDALNEQQARLSLARDDRIVLLRRLLPAKVADRVAAGDGRTLEEIPDASAVVVVLRGLDASAEGAAESSDRELVDGLHADLDDLAERHGLERVKVVGDAYFAACGHDRPYLDHAPRSVAFAADAQDAVREIGAATPDGLDVAIGLGSGRVTVAMTGGTRMIYDVWGPAVTTAHQLARRADPGQIVVSDAARRRLPETIAATRVDNQREPSWVLAPASIGGRP